MKECHPFGDILRDLQPKWPIELRFVVGEEAQQVLVLYELRDYTKRLRAEPFQLHYVRMIQATCVTKISSAFPK